MWRRVLWRFCACGAFSDVFALRVPHVLKLSTRRPPAALHGLSTKREYRFQHSVQRWHLESINVIAACSSRPVDVIQIYWTKCVTNMIGSVPQEISHGGTQSAWKRKKITRQSRCKNDFKYPKEMSDKYNVILCDFQPRFSYPLIQYQKWKLIYTA